MQLRPYQAQSVTELSQGFKDHQRQILCLPTGGGKTIVFSDIVEKAAKRGTVTLVLTDRTELFKQTIKALAKFNIVTEEISPKKKHVYMQATVYVGMVETLKRRKQLLDELPIELIICDEAHKQNFNKILDAFPDAYVIGATATPIGKHLYKYYNNIVHTVDVPELVDNGYLVPCKPFQMVDDFSDLEKKSGNDFTTESLGNHFQKTTVYDGVVQWWKQKAMGKKTIVFNCSIEHSEAVTEHFKQAGISAESITSKTSPEERKRILSAFANNSFSVLNNCGILTTGYDEPTIGCVILNRATESLPLFLQMIGRGSRLIDGSTGFLPTREERLFSIASSSKPNFTVLDFGGNHDRHGLWSEAREWSLEKPKRKKAGVQVAPVKTCPQCEAMLMVQAKECDFCQYVFPENDRELKQGGVMQEMTVSDYEGQQISALSVDDLINLQNLKKYKSAYIWRIIRSMGIDALKEYTKKKEYKKGWYIKQKDLLNDAEFNDHKITV